LVFGVGGGCGGGGGGGGGVGWVWALRPKNGLIKNRQKKVGKVSLAKTCKGGGGGLGGGGGGGLGGGGGVGGVGFGSWFVFWVFGWLWGVCAWCVGCELSPPLMEGKDRPILNIMGNKPKGKSFRTEFLGHAETGRTGFILWTC